MSFEGLTQVFKSNFIYKKKEDLDLFDFFFVLSSLHE
jgi:hypothetical protein